MKFVKRKKMKQYLIVRGDLKMKSGKVASQCCHSSNKIILDNLIKHPIKWITRIIGYKIFKKWIRKDTISDWLNGSFTKIVLKIPSDYKKQDNILDYLYDFSLKRGHLVSLITDNGKTVFNGIKTKTVLCIGPFDTKDPKNEDLNYILKGFKLL